MSKNQEIADLFEEMADLLELTGANAFRVNATRKVARTLEELPSDVGDMENDPKQITAIDGIGAGSAKRIIEYLQDDQIADLEALRSEVPTGLIQVLGVPGLGPKTVATLWKEANVTGLESLRKAIDRGALESLPRMGKKTVDNIRQSLDFVAAASTRYRLDQAMQEAESIVASLSSTPGVNKITYAGSLRRGRDTVGDVDIIATTSKPDALAERFTSLPEIAKVQAKGSTKCSIRRTSGLQVDLRMFKNVGYGAALLHFTGSKEHNVVLRQRAIDRGQRLSEYGLFEENDGDEPRLLEAESEENIYAALGLPWIPPPLREDRGEFVDQLPTLIEIKDIRSDLHSHTTASDGKLSIEEMAKAAKKRGLKVLAITDHSRSSFQANGLDVDRLKAHIDAIHEVNDNIKGITLLAGSEVDIHAEGNLDYEDDILAQLDIVVASPHMPVKQEPAAATKRLIRAVSHPLVNILGHPTARLINRRAGLEPDMAAVVAAATDSNTALEINANPMRLDLRDTHARLAMEGGCMISINTDAHGADQFDLLRYGIMTAQRGWVTADRCINTWTTAKLKKWIAAGRTS